MDTPLRNDQELARHPGWFVPTPEVEQLVAEFSPDLRDRVLALAAKGWDGQIKSIVQYLREQSEEIKGKYGDADIVVPGLAGRSLWERFDDLYRELEVGI